MSKACLHNLSNLFLLLVRQHAPSIVKPPLHLITQYVIRLVDLRHLFSRFFLFLLSAAIGVPSQT
jgi:hypothetical protein